MSSESDAIAEVAKTIGKGLDATTDFGKYLGVQFDAPIRTLIGMIDDNLRYKRLENTIKIFHKTDKLLKDNGIDIDRYIVNPKISIPFIHAASLEDNEMLCDKWANLLANAVDANSKIAIDKLYISILSDLNPIDALNMQIIYNFSNENKSKELWTKYLPEKIVAAKPTDGELSPSEEINLSLSNLNKLGLINSALFLQGPNTNFICVQTTFLGQKFIDATTYP